jgi:hypothetical protein
MSSRQFPPVETGRSDQTEILDIHTNFGHEIIFNNLSFQEDEKMKKKEKETQREKKKLDRTRRTACLPDNFRLSRLGEVTSQTSLIFVLILFMRGDHSNTLECQICPQTVDK